MIKYKLMLVTFTTYEWNRCYYTNIVNISCMSFTTVGGLMGRDGDCSGNTIKSITTNVAIEKCHPECDTESTCVGFTHKTPRGNSNMDSCELKSASCENTTSSSLIIMYDKTSKFWFHVNNKTIAIFTRSTSSRLISTDDNNPTTPASIKSPI